jgi:hypothetical protein
MRVSHYKHQRLLKQYTIFCGVVGIVSLLLLSQTASATPPSDIVLQYDITTQLLSVTITHASANVNEHYIYKVELQKNGHPFNTSIYTSQPDPTSFTYTYTVNATTGDVISVTATCILYGSLTKQLTVTSSGSSTKKSTPGFEFVLVCVGLLVAMSFYTIQRKK